MELFIQAKDKQEKNELITTQCVLKYKKFNDLRGVLIIWVVSSILAKISKSMEKHGTKRRYLGFYYQSKWK